MRNTFPVYDRLGPFGLLGVAMVVISAAMQFGEHLFAWQSLTSQEATSPKEAISLILLSLGLLCMIMAVLRRETPVRHDAKEDKKKLKDEFLPMFARQAFKARDADDLKALVAACNETRITLQKMPAFHSPLLNSCVEKIIEDLLIVGENTPYGQSLTGFAPREKFEAEKSEQPIVKAWLDRTKISEIGSKFVVPDWRWGRLDAVQQPYSVFTEIVMEHLSQTRATISTLKLMI